MMENKQIIDALGKVYDDSQSALTTTILASSRIMVQEKALKRVEKAYLNARDQFEQWKTYEDSHRNLRHLLAELEEVFEGGQS